MLDMEMVKHWAVKPSIFFLANGHDNLTHSGAATMLGHSYLEVPAIIGVIRVVAIDPCQGGEISPTKVGMIMT